MRIKVIGGVALTTVMLTVGCGEADNADGEDKNASGWCDDLDKIIARGWEYDGGANDGGSVDDMNRIVRGYVREYRGYTDDEMASLNDALEEAWSSGSRYDGKEAARAWEDSLREAC